MSAQASPIKWYSPERVLAIAAAAFCVLLTASLWLSLSRQQAMWPLPALYFLEMVAASLVGLWTVYRDKAPANLLVWAAVGVQVGFALIGALSVGFFYLPAAGLLGLAALWLDRHAWRQLPLHLGLALLAAVAQAALMLVLIRVLNPGAIF
jgi:hypothetical protein